MSEREEEVKVADVAFREEVVKITDVAYGGDGAARLEDGRICFIPFVGLNELVRIRIIKESKKFCRGEVIEVMEASVNRVEAPCPHYETCGGCNYQHLAYEAQVELKEAQFRQVVRRIGGLDITDDKVEVVASERAYNYRNRITLAPQRRADDEDRSEELAYGFVARDKRTIIPIKECLLAREPVNEMISKLNKTRWGRKNMSRDKPKKATLRYAQGNDEGLIFYGLAPEGMPWRRDINGGEDFSVPTGSFSQVNHEVAEKLQEMCASIVAGLDGCKMVIDAFCGSGFLSMGMKDVDVIGLEIDAHGAEAANYNANERGLENHKYIRGDVDRLLMQRLGKRVNEILLLLDPPRMGCGEGTMKAIAKKSPRWVLYVSCDPATLGRDLQQLVAMGYEKRQLAMLDMFPQTSHFESLILLERGNVG